LKEPRTSAFTLIELLVVMGIIGILAGMIMPSLGTAREKGRRIDCVGNLHQIGLALTMYCDDYGEYVPNNTPAGLPNSVYTGTSTHRIRGPAGFNIGLGKLAPAYTRDVRIFGCPSNNPYQPKVVQNAWRESGNVESAYLWRETDATLTHKKLSMNQRTPAFIMDNADVTGGWGDGHSFEWTNVWFIPGYVRGYNNERHALKDANPTPPPNWTNINTRFSHDQTPEVIDVIWENADRLGRE
jgi:prepilin-type N-terminal cleavage/methylation domain-containing protein